MHARELVVLGCASQVPTRHRNHNGYALRFDLEAINRNNFELPLLTMGQGRCRHRGTIPQPDLLQGLLRRLQEFRVLCRGLPEAKGVSGMGLNRQCRVLERRHVAEDRRDLKGAGETQVRASPGRQAGDVLASEEDPAGIRLQLAGKLGDQSRLASAVRADDGMNLPGENLQREIVARRQAAEALDEVAGRQ